MQFINAIALDRVTMLIRDATTRVISFDIFDTLLVRPAIKPTDVFYFLQKDARVLFQSESYDFYALRLCAEREARTALGRKNPQYGEITLTQIYDHIAEKYRLNHEDASALMQAEIDIETHLFTVRKYVKQLYDLAIECGKRVILVSDMYLEKSVVENILRLKGITQYGELYLSSDCKKRKDTGELFTYVVEQEHVLPSEILHIGDNRVSDKECAEKA